jgi:Na+-driven multidrug efflux pump
LALSEEVKRQLWLAGPLIAGNLLQNLIPVISVMLVGHLGELPLAGASMANQPESMQQAASLQVMDHLLTKLAAEKGAEKPAEAAKPAKKK